MKARTQARRMFQNKMNRFGSSIKGLSMIGSKKKPKPWTSSQRKKTVAQQKANRIAARGISVFEALGGRAKGVTPKSASRYAVKARHPIGFETVKEPHTRTETVWVGYDRAGNWIGKNVESVVTEERKVLKPFGEKLVLKRLHKKGGGPGGTKSSGGERISHKTGSSMAVRTHGRKTGKLGGTRGGIPQKEKKKPSKQPQVMGKTKS